MAKLENTFSWSKSRDGVFQTCPRQYYYNYYASWGGWDEAAAREVREIYVLKKLQTRQMWAGDVVHSAIGRSLKHLKEGKAVRPVDEIVKITLERMRNDFRSSRNGEYRSRKVCALFEHEYKVPVPDAEWQELAARVERCLRTFYASELYGQVARLPRESILEVEQPEKFDFEGTAFWVVLDAGWRAEEGIIIADWKTGDAEPGGYELQMTGYALYAAGKWGVDPRQLTLLEYNLASDRMHRYPGDAATVERTKAYIRGSIADMQSLLADPARNLPLPMDRFTQVSRLEICERCSFFKVCRPPIPAGRP